MQGLPRNRTPMHRLPPHLIRQKISEFSVSTWDIEVTPGFQENREEEVRRVTVEGSYFHDVNVFLRIPNAMRTFYGGEPMSGLWGFLPTYLNFTTLNPVENNTYDIRFDHAILRLHSQNPNLVYAITIRYSIDEPLGGVPNVWTGHISWNTQQYSNILRIIKSHAARLMANFCLRYLPEPTNQTRMWRLGNTNCYNDAWWRNLFANTNHRLGSNIGMGLIPVVNNTVVSLDRRTQVLNEKETLKF